MPPADPTPPYLPGAPYVAYRDGELWVEDVPLAQLAREHGTPLFVYSLAALRAAAAAWQQALAGRDAQVCYAMKANSTLAIVQALVQAGCGVDIVSGGELARALRAGVAPDRIVFSGVGKTRAEMRAALQAGIGCFNVESRAELEVLDAVARELGVRAPVSLRVNPDVDAQTHPYISTGLRDNKFGIAHDEALDAYRHAAALPGLQVVGIDCHIGSQITTIAPYLDALDRVLDLVEAIEADGIALHHLDLGGGLGIEYHGEQPPTPQALVQALLARLDARGHGGRRLLFEPGRSLVGNAGVCVTEVLYLKPGTGKNFLIVDAAMNDLPRPAMYEAWHAIAPLRPRSDLPAIEWDVVGPVCESGDWLGRGRRLAVQPGDWLAVGSAGAYCMSMASHYNTRGKAAEVLVAGARSQLIRARETVADLWRQERVLALD
ncbi:diaminopimelate decarboxylase [Tepidimonas aquatica]|uniref:Diaminopimelate decarboxylase n=1 Tax=Tepidimonas aquatica TaxID=247482 RepID=A0A554WJU6_9BURK|nr:diaminopimelate decarboxylase [Tepidimonas aquatica]TSE23842.1 Diaminopimelate decarboxylase [Tepidimonas aquatica]